MDGATLTELDGTPIVRRLRRPFRIGRTGVLVICAVAIAVDLALQLVSFLPSWSGYESAGTLPLTLTNMIGGVVAFLLPAAFVLRSPDAWQARPMLLLGALLGAGSELAQSAGPAVSGLAVLQFNAGSDTTWPSFLPDADVVSRIALVVGLLAGAAGTLLFAFGLTRLRERSAARSTRGVTAVALVVVGLLALWGLWPLWWLSADWALWTVPAMLSAGIVASLYRAWVILTGWSAGEAPRRAWGWAAVSTVVGLATLVIGYLLGPVGASGLGPGLSVTVLVVGIAGGLLFVAAVADGLGASPAADQSP